MPLLAALRTISNYTRLLRYGNSLNSSQRYLIRRREGHIKTSKRPFLQHFRALEQNCDHNFKVNITRNRIYGRVPNVHVNKTRNMTSELETGLNDSQKENDDISLPFWILLWSFLAVVAGFIYSKLNRQKEIESELKLGVKPNINDEQIARKLVNEIARKDSGKKPTFKRQRSYEIIDGEVRIHYDVSMLDDSLHKSTNSERLLKTAEVESIPIRSTSLEDLEFVNPGKLPSIVEEGDEDLEDQSEEQTSLTSINEAPPDAQIDIHETKGKETKKTATNIHISNSNENTCNAEGKGLHSEKKQNEFPTSFETITQETLIPVESINDANEITINPQKGNCVSFKHESETELRGIKNGTNLNDEEESNSISADGETENVSEISNVTNSSHNSNTTSTAVYKLSQVEKTQEHKFTVTRRKITKLKSSKEKSLKSGSIDEETSIHSVKTKGREKTGENGDDCSQLSRDLQSDDFVPQQGNQSGSTGYSKNSNQQTGQRKVPEHEVMKVVDVSSADVYECPGTSLDPNKPIVNLPDEDVNECRSMSLAPAECCEVEAGVLTFLEENSDILVDNSGDILFKVIDPSTDNTYLDIEHDEDDNSGELTFDENQNVGDKNDLVKNWTSLPSWEGVHSIKHRELSRYSSDVGHVDLDTNSVHDTDQSLQHKENDLKQKNLGNGDEEFAMQNGEVFSEDIKDAHLLEFENKIGSRKTIFVKDVVEPVDVVNDESEESFVEKKSLDIKGNEEVPAFRENESENIPGEDE